MSLTNGVKEYECLLAIESGGEFKKCLTTLPRMIPHFYWEISLGKIPKKTKV